ncbi:MAG: hypothetical protein ACOC1F_00245 [Myxococcota bacterium]
MRSRFWLGAMLILACACSDKEKADPQDIFGSGASSGGTSSPGLCREYCQALVEGAPGCERYNDGGRCVNICEFYMSGACQQTYEAFAECMRSTGGGSCIPNESGKLALVVEGCSEPHAAWIACRDARDAGICPY